MHQTAVDIPSARHFSAMTASADLARCIPLLHSLPAPRRSFTSAITAGAKERLERLKARHEELCTQLSGQQFDSTDVVFSAPEHCLLVNSSRIMGCNAGEHTNKLPQQELTALNVELGELTPAVEAYNALQRLLTEAKGLEDMLNGEDDDMRKLAREEQQALEEQVRTTIFILL